MTRELVAAIPNGFLVAGEDYENCQRDVIRILQNRKKEEICILKKTYAGDSHDANWQDHLYVLDKEVWADELDKVVKAKSGGCFDPSVVDYFTDIEKTLNDWIRFDCDRDSRRIYTCKRESDRKIRKEYKICWSSAHLIERGIILERFIECLCVSCVREEVISRSEVYYGELSEKSLQSWESVTDPADVLASRYELTCWDEKWKVMRWAAKNCFDRIQLTKNATAWKCKGEKLLDLDIPYIGTSGRTEPDRIYGIVFQDVK